MTASDWVALVLLLLLGGMALVDVFRYMRKRDDFIDSDNFGDRDQ